jgi:hypothetical protein
MEDKPTWPGTPAGSQTHKDVDLTVSNSPAGRLRDTLADAEAVVKAAEDLLVWLGNGEPVEPIRRLRAAVDKWRQATT